MNWTQVFMIAPVLVVTTSCGHDAPEVHERQIFRWDAILNEMEWPGVPWQEAGKLREWFLHQEAFQEYAGPLDELYISVNFKDPSTVVMLTLSRRRRPESTSAVGIAAVVFVPRR